MDIYLVRHGEAAASWGQESDPGLSEQGRLEAEAVVTSLADRLHENVALFSSPLQRAQETAEPLAAQLGKPVTVDSVFREVPSPVPLAERQTWLRQFMAQQWSEQGEELLRWRDDAFQRLMAMEQSTVVFTHFLVINAVVGQVQGRAETLVFGPGNGSITHLRRTEEGLTLVSLGEQLESFIN